MKTNKEILEQLKLIHQILDTDKGMDLHEFSKLEELRIALVESIDPRQIF